MVNDNCDTYSFVLIFFIARWHQNAIKRVSAGQCTCTSRSWNCKTAV